MTENSTALKAVLDEVFIYAIGDLVCLRTTVEPQRVTGPTLTRHPHFSERGGFARDPVPLQVLGRTVEECSGGAQLMYSVRVFQDGKYIVAKVFDYELVSHEEAISVAIVFQGKLDTKVAPKP